VAVTIDQSEGESPDLSGARRFAVVWRGLRRSGVYEDVVKRALDVCLGSLLVALTFPLWLLIAVAIRLDSRGPALFVQERVGSNGIRFNMFKFRSMRSDAEPMRSELAALNELDGPVFKIRNDPRVTRVGRVLRRTSLDELPQLLNVISGEMSLVGPRPPLAEEVRQYRPADWARLSVKPGLTCLWQVNGRSDCSFDQWMEYDRDYIRRLSLGLDLQILLKTVWVVVTLRGAY
jgi:exopolysaccharide biosynthesis polyprenyl glycosylphosphotransferase